VFGVIFIVGGICVGRKSGNIIDGLKRRDDTKVVSSNFYDLNTCYNNQPCQQYKPNRLLLFTIF
jgi:hypothetical protein